MDTGRRLSVMAVMMMALCIRVCAVHPADQFGTPISLGSGGMPGMAIDKLNRLHLVYTARDGLMYRLGDLSGSFGPAEVALSKVPLWDPRVYIDENNNPHVIAADGHIGNTYVYYTNRIGGSWKSELVVFDVVRDDFDRATTPTLYVHNDKVFAGCFTVGASETEIPQWGALALIENVSATPTLGPVRKIYAWNPQVFVRDGKLWVGGRNKAQGSRNFTFQEHDMGTLAEKGTIYRLSGGVHGEMARANIDGTGDIMAAGTINGAGVSNAGWYNTLTRAQSGKSAIRYRTALVNPCGMGVPIRDRKATDRVYVVYWSDSSGEHHEPKSCQSGVQLRFMRVENGAKASEFNPVTDRTFGHGPAYRLTPCAVPHPNGGVIVVFRECLGSMFMTTIGEQVGVPVKPVLPRRAAQGMVGSAPARRSYTINGAVHCHSAAGLHGTAAAQVIVREQSHGRTVGSLQMSR